MLSITPQEVTPEILNLFDLDKPTMPRAFNVLEGIIKGEIITDHLTQPDWAVVREAIYGTLYFGGHITSSVISSILSICVVGENRFDPGGKFLVWISAQKESVMMNTPQDRYIKKEELNDGM